MVDNYDLVGLDGYRKSDKIKSLVTQALVSSESLVLLNRVEELVEYFELNDHFNVIVSGTLKTLINYQYPNKITFILAVKESSQSIKSILGLM